MIKLNYIQYPSINEMKLTENLSFQALKDNSVLEKEIEHFKQRFNFSSMNSFSFTQEGFVSLFLQLGGKIMVSLGESQAIIDAAHAYKKLGFDIEFIPLTKEGNIDYSGIDPTCDYIFISSYVMDTYVKINLSHVKELTKAKIISNVSATLHNDVCDAAILDAYKLTGFAFSSLIVHNNLLEEQYLGSFDTIALYQIKEAVKNFTTNDTIKYLLKEALEEELKEDIYFFVDPKSTLSYTLHFGLKGIKAREIIRTLALSGIYVTNGEGCSLGLSRPSRILQEMGYEEHESRWALSLSFKEELNHEQIVFIAQTIAKKYRQIKRLHQYD